jgi:hypothetical protein
MAQLGLSYGSATWRPKLRDPALMSTAMSKMAPRMTRTSFPWDAARPGNAAHGPLPFALDKEWLSCTNTASMPTARSLSGMIGLAEEAAFVAMQLGRNDPDLGDV